MIRVLHVFGRLERGGAETRTMDLYRAIDRDRVQFDFAVHFPEEGAYEAQARELGARIFRFPAYRIYNHLAYRKAWRVFLREHPEYESVHIHTTNNAHASLPELVRAGVRQRIVHARNAGNPGLVRRMVARLARGTLNRLSTDRLAVSALAGKYVFGERDMDGVRVLPNAIDVERFRFNPSAREDMRAALDVADKLVVGHVGRFEMQKNHGFLLDAFVEMAKIRADAVLVLAGDGPLRAQTEEKVRALGVKDKVLFLGVRPDVPDLMQAMDVLALPSLFEGMPGVILEAQAAGLPCVISDAVTRECALVPGLCAFLPIGGGAQAWARALIEADANDRAEAADAMRAAGFDAREQANVYMTLYERAGRGAH